MLEISVDSFGLADVLKALADMCRKKALRYQDETTNSLWSDAAECVDRCADSPEIRDMTFKRVPTT
jgi:hypothetical protein